MNDLTHYLKTHSATIQKELDALLPPSSERPTRLHEAMRYSVFAGGKRLRPILCTAACEACGGNRKQAHQAACAIELLHTYTLIHDDLPAMDDDTLRRGRPTCHIAFDEGLAILAGDALLTLAFEILASIPIIGSALALELGRAAGSRGIIGGQAEDLAAENQIPDADLIDYIHRNKTASLIRAACVMGGICAGGDSEQHSALSDFGENLGLAFQLLDDLLDRSATVEDLGKDIGSDVAKGKMTWPAVHGIDATQQRADELTRAACLATTRLRNGEVLEAIAIKMLKRKS